MGDNNEQFSVGDWNGTTYTRRLTVDTATGSVGIGRTPTADYVLAVNGWLHTSYNVQTLPASNAGGGLAVAWNKSGGWAEVNLYNVYDNAYGSFQFLQKTGATTAAILMTIRGNGNVGIGTDAANPTAALHVGTGQIKIASRTIADDNGCYYA